MAGALGLLILVGLLAGLVGLAEEWGWKGVLAYTAFLGSFVGICWLIT